MREVQRCLNCDVETAFNAPACIECDACIDICPVQCLTITSNGDEADLRSRLSAPAPNLDQDLYVSAPLPQTGRVMVKDENVCVHCGLCAERCPDRGLGHGALRPPDPLRRERELHPHRRHVAERRESELVMAIDEARDQRTQVNDFSIKLANVNGTGSASANSLLMQAIFRMGIPVSGKNLFPSNIQGLPTWYEIRVNKTGYTARALDYDLVVAMNSQTYAQDIADVRHGGYVIYDSSWPLDPDLTREDVTFLGIPLAKMCLENFKAPRERILMKNIAYAGAVVALGRHRRRRSWPISSAETFARNEALRDSNQRALRLGYDYAMENLRVPAAVLRRAHGRQRQRHPDQRQPGHGPRVPLRRRHRRRLVPDHPGDRGHGQLHPAVRPVPPRDRGERGPERPRRDAQQLPDHPGRGRDRLDRHGARRGLERRAGLHLDLRSGHLA